MALLLLAALTFHQTTTYENLEVLYRDVMAKNETAVIAYSNLATHLGSLGRNEEGLELIRKAVEIDPQARRTQQPGRDSVDALYADGRARRNVRRIRA